MKSIKRFFFLVTLVFAFQVNGQSVYTTKTGEKYHKETCHFLKYSNKEIALEKAIEYGYQACKVCKPTKKTATTKTNLKGTKVSSQTTTPVKKVIASQCTGRTKAGRRCKRKTKSTNGRCYQH